MEFTDIMEIINDFPCTGNIVFDYLFMGLMLFEYFFLWCIIKIFEYPILTVIAVIAYVFWRAVETRSKIDIWGNLWKWRR